MILLWITARMTQRNGTERVEVYTYMQVNKVIEAIIKLKRSLCSCRGTDICIRCVHLKDIKKTIETV